MNRDLSNSIALTARLSAILLMTLLLPGCAGFGLGKGVAEAIL